MFIYCHIDNEKLKNTNTKKSSKKNFEKKLKKKRKFKKNMNRK